MMIKNRSFDKLIGTKLGSYRLEQFLEQGTRGPVFLARTDASTTTYLVRLLPEPVNLTINEQESYLEHFQHLAHQLTTLQHPHILPVLDYGIDRDIPYLVSPHLPMRSLRTRLDKSGALDVFTAGRYLDQIAAALEYAHEHAVLHGMLTVDCIFIRLDGQLMIADFGLMGLLGFNRAGVNRELLSEWGEACAPEQLLGRPLSPATDVYALGAVLYHLLTGSPVFTGSTPDEVAQQHMYTAVPPLTQRRADLPSGLYSLLARALAKEPRQRYTQPGAFANAYHRIITANNRTRVPFVVASSHPTSAEHPPSAESSLIDAPISEFIGGHNHSSTVGLERGECLQFPQAPSPHSLHGFSDTDLLRNREERPLTRLQRQQRHQVVRQWRTALLALLVLLVVASSVLGVAFFTRQPDITGQVTFFDDPHGLPGSTDSLSLVVQGLQAPPTDSHYAAWLINDTSEQVIPLGLLTTTGQGATLHFFGAGSSGRAGPNLLAAGQRLEITLEQGTVKLPTGRVVLVGAFPPKAVAHIQHLLVGFPETPGKIGMLVGLLKQTRLLNIQADVLQSLVTSHDPQGIQCVAQSLLDVVEGRQGSDYKPLATPCVQEHVSTTGDGFGLLGKGYLDGVAEHASLAVNQPDSTSAMRLHAGLMAIALANIKTWLNTIDQDALRVRVNPADLSRVPEIATLADVAYHGMDTNGDGLIDPVTGEAGALTAYLQGQLMVTLSLTSTVQ